MIQGTNRDQDWVHQQGSVVGQEDHTVSGRCRGKRKEQNTSWAGFSPQLATMMGSEKLLETLDSVCIPTLTKLFQFSGMLSTPARLKETKNNLN